jgi:hypothetical protein
MSYRSRSCRFPAKCLSNSRDIPRVDAPKPYVEGLGLSGSKTSGQAAPGLKGNGDPLLWSSYCNVRAWAPLAGLIHEHIAAGFATSLGTNALALRGYLAMNHDGASKPAVPGHPILRETQLRAE